MAKENSALDRLKQKVEQLGAIEEPAAAVIEPEIRTPAQYAMYTTLPDDSEDLA
ncbi:hypothetical protein [Kitasatospora sp. GP82]|uniref:hypothetical protein n=1 Tax=Kitasatospora sp. GP82 TaxID=3035089 RepID=UPI002474A679|nr:hypothetical protein [Kitasatospora sp. GP82]MDH6126857.1 hypothetical protein [Kitasatospora sp. GP82]